MGGIMRPGVAACSPFSDLGLEAAGRFAEPQPRVLYGVQVHVLVNRYRFEFLLIQRDREDRVLLFLREAAREIGAELFLQQRDAFLAPAFVPDRVLDNDFLPNRVRNKPIESALAFGLVGAYNLGKLTRLYLMIPAFNVSGVLPPFDPTYGPTKSATSSPYTASTSELVRRFAVSDERVVILRGLLDYRQQLANVGIVDGFQWMDGSFLENCESINSRPPRDIDLVTFAHRPVAHSAMTAWLSFFNANRHLFDRNQTKARFHCDAYYVDLDRRPEFVVNNTRYWFGLFSHQRSTYLWKGMVQVPLISDDVSARSLL